MSTLCPRFTVSQFLFQVYHWTVRNAVVSPPELWRRSPQPLCARCAQLCSSTLHNTPQVTQHNHQVSHPASKDVAELSLRSLLDMGFTETQAEHVHDTVSRVRGGSAAKRALSTLTALFVLGLNPSSVLKVLEKCPDLYTVKESLFQQRIGNLRKLGLVEGGIVLFLCNTINQSTSKHCLNGSAHQSLVFFFLYCVQEVFREWWPITPRS